MLAQTGFRLIVLEHTQDTWGLWRGVGPCSTPSPRCSSARVGRFADGKLCSRIKGPRCLGRKLLIRVGALALPCPPRVLRGRHPVRRGGTASGWRKRWRCISSDTWCLPCLTSPGALTITDIQADRAGSRAAGFPTGRIKKRPTGRLSCAPPAVRLGRTLVSHACLGAASRASIPSACRPPRGHPDQTTVPPPRRLHRRQRQTPC